MMRFLIALCALLVAVPAAAQNRESPRAAMQAYGRCVADASPGRAGEVLLMDFTSPAYKRALTTLSEVNRGCFGKRRGTLKSAGLPFAGAMAEQLIAKDVTPLNIRLARAVALPAVPARNATDRIAICVVRSVPDDVARLFATKVDSEEEKAAIDALGFVVTRCSEGVASFHASSAGLRAMLATAAFRTLEAGRRGTGAK